MEKVTITLKLYSHIDKELSLRHYNPAEGIEVSLKKGKRLKDFLKKAGIGYGSEYVFFKDTEQISLRHKLSDGDIISCLKPSGGG